jgi:ubiquitin-protein ligase
MLAEPDYSYPVNCEAAALYKEDRAAFLLKAQEWTRMYASD